MAGWVQGKNDTPKGVVARDSTVWAGLMRSAIPNRRGTAGPKAQSTHSSRNKTDHPVEKQHGAKAPSIHLLIIHDLSIVLTHTHRL